LSQRLVRFALLASATSLLGYARPASAQIPILQAERLDEPAPAASVPVEPGPPAPLPAAPPPPPGAAAPPGGAPPVDAAPPGPATGVPAPAKAALIATPGARRAAEARAEQRDVEEDSEAQLALGHHWYGWQTLTADAVSLSAIVAGVALDDTRFGGDFGWMGLLGYEFAPGVMHFAHRNPGRGFASFGLRLGLPLAGAFAGATFASSCDDNLCEVSGAAVGVLVGMAGAIAIDAAVFAYDDPKPSAVRRLGLVPLVSVAPHQAWFGIGGQL
jgi:hypothetical protein